MPQIVEITNRKRMTYYGFSCPFGKTIMARSQRLMPESCRKINREKTFIVWLATAPLVPSVISQAVHFRKPACIRNCNYTVFYLHMKLCPWTTDGALLNSHRKINKINIVERVLNFLSYGYWSNELFYTSYMQWLQNIFLKYHMFPNDS